MICPYYLLELPIHVLWLHWITVILNKRVSCGVHRFVHSWGGRYRCWANSSWYDCKRWRDTDLHPITVRHTSASTSISRLPISFIIFLYLISNFICIHRCDRNDVTIQSTVSKTALKEQQQADQKSKTKDISNFSLYSSFRCSVQRIQHHQV